MQDMREFIEQMNNNGEFIGKHTVMQEFVKRATSGISKPIEVEKLDDILIDEGITEAVKLSGLKSINKGLLTKWMKEAGFTRKQIMTDGERAWYWVSSATGKTGINAKIALKEFLTGYLKLMDSISYDDLKSVLTEKGFTQQTWNSHFFYSDGQLEGSPKIWDGWVLKGGLRDKVYTKVSIKSENSDE